MISSNNSKKQPFDIDERVALIHACSRLGEHVTVDAFLGLTVDFARRHGRFIVRGLRAVAISRPAPNGAHEPQTRSEIDTTFLMTRARYGYVGSSLAKEVAQFGGDVTAMLPGPVAPALRSESRRAHAYNPSQEVAATDIIFPRRTPESLVTASKKLPTSNVVLSQAAAGLTSQLRSLCRRSASSRITEESGRITERAREEGDAIVARAQEQAVQMLEERELVRAAQQRAAEILDRAQDEAREVRRGADEYAAGVLIRLEGECIKALTSIKRGIDMLDERHRPQRRRRRASSPAGDAIAVTAGEGAGAPAVTAFNAAGLLHDLRRDP